MKTKKIWRDLLVRLWIVAMVVGTLASSGLAHVSGQESSDSSANSETLSVLLLGVDTGDLGRVDHGRSDVLMLMTVNPVTEKITITSIPRDAYVMLADYHYMDKINHAYAFGGPAMSIATVENWLGIEIDHYVAVNMAGLKEIVDAVGGVTVVPPTSFSISGYDFTAGVETYLDGDMALAYSRERYTSGGDYARQERQRQVVFAVLKNASSAMLSLQAESLFNSLSANVETDLTVFELLPLFMKYRNATNNIEFHQLSGSGSMIDGIYYDIIDDYSLNEMLTRLSGELE